MRKTLCILALLCAFTAAAQAQATLEMMRLKLRQFDYTRVIELADTLLQHQEKLPRQELIEVYETRGVAQYSLQQLDAALASFAALLAVAPEHRLDPGNTSPKIIRFFEEIRQSLARQQTAEPAAASRVDTLRLIDPGPGRLAAAMRRSLLWPGWGHLYLERRQTGAALAAAHLALLGTTVWAAVECRDRQKEYLAATVPAQINSRYDSWNRSYRRRSGLAAATALLWVASQADLLIFHPPAASTAWIYPSIDLERRSLLCSCSIFF